MATRSPTKPGYPIGKVAFIEGYKHVNGRPHGPRHPAEDIFNSSHRQTQHRLIEHSGPPRGGADTAVATASGIDPRLIRIYHEIESCVQGIQAIRQHLDTMAVVDNKLDA
ncbi:hypothetical protein H310_04100 [Aphanomyces invadans]|uniref:Uncharacterized protein n=1 Tax=Aphanomyces invadans TaxID=157072 RepID=A0A024UFU1_9STRA|nr:hypothetical protein H310_04100 [Aphanomyces invadans]ETW05065.1 hypothetical protein H310_04100 [Aphanomyces invadans]|eukprot:XP_008866503.1 hypothetical protein H310_04100 [Aphanomyces invadans]